jgi:hypothetical protein
MKTDLGKELQIATMGDILFSRFAHFMNKNDYETAFDVRSEWVIDEQDPEDGEYQFLFIDDLTQFTFD